MLELLGVVCVGCENGIDVASIVGIKLALNDCGWIHAGFCRSAFRRLQEDKLISLGWCCSWVSTFLGIEGQKRVMLLSG